MCSWHQLSALCTSSAIAEFQERTGIELEKPFKAFLCNTANGAQATSNQSFEVQGHPYEQIVEVHCLLGVDTEDHRFDIERTWNGLGSSAKAWLLPFGYDASGNQICFQLIDGKCDGVVFWDLEEDSVLDESSFAGLKSAVFKVADSFEEFLRSLDVHSSQS